MDERQEKSILEMGRGAIMERADYEMRAMIRNILDPNTSAKAARKLNITLTFKPGDDRQTIVVECVAKSTAMTSREPSTSTLRATCYPLFWPSAPRRRSPISLPCTLMTRIWPLLWRL